VIGLAEVWIIGSTDSSISADGATGGRKISFSLQSIHGGAENPTESDYRKNICQARLIAAK